MTHFDGLVLSSYVRLYASAHQPLTPSGVASLKLLGMHPATSNNRALNIFLTILGYKTIPIPTPFGYTPLLRPSHYKLDNTRDILYAINKGVLL